MFIHANDFPPSSFSLSLPIFSLSHSPHPPIQLPTDHHQPQHSGLARVQRIAQEVQNDRFQPHRYGMLFGNKTIRKAISYTVRHPLSRDIL